jgi:hypothetical protein
MEFLLTVTRGEGVKMQKSRLDFQRADYQS